MAALNSLSHVLYVWYIYLVDIIILYRYYYFFYWRVLTCVRPKEPSATTSLTPDCTVWRPVASPLIGWFTFQNPPWLPTGGGHSKHPVKCYEPPDSLTRWFQKGACMHVRHLYIFRISISQHWVNTLQYYIIFFSRHFYPKQNYLHIAWSHWLPWIHSCWCRMRMKGRACWPTQGVSSPCPKLKLRQ